MLSARVSRLGARLRQAVVRDPKRISFTCNVCSTHNVKEREQLTRDDPSCDACRSCVRFRWVVYALSRELYGRPLRLSQFRSARHIRGAGLSDWDVYAKVFQEKLDYTNTFFHTEPRLDVCKIGPDMYDRYDFLIASDVLEHVLPPPVEAMKNLYRMLRPGGFLLFTVPWTPTELTQEHYPEMYDFTVEEKDGVYTVVNRTRDGRVQRFENPVFHGGPGTTLEMRVFAGGQLQAELKEAGFQIEVRREHAPKSGIVMDYHWSLPIIARKPGPRPATS